METVLVGVLVPCCTVVAVVIAFFVYTKVIRANVGEGAPSKKDRVEGKTDDDGAVRVTADMCVIVDRNNVPATMWSSDGLPMPPSGPVGIEGAEVDPSTPADTYIRYDSQRSGPMVLRSSTKGLKEAASQTADDAPMNSDVYYVRPFMQMGSDRHLGVWTNQNVECVRDDAVHDVYRAGPADSLLEDHGGFLKVLLLMLLVSYCPTPE
eukprot:CAMPEP_0113683210 /NCGR_PEP_ID=MMETSP0038_2-20120614/13152_1 /TAXON_ID=2898 /ORGANISM="Cryptomonas paramecium" /LENGTH=207 /DNA_ID=CAMNT_0000602485 /DNA_START=92 /DNA_END=715 /DNA_ORIENTATION=- /assembly_acc=CAM_ASM_000170